MSTADYLSSHFPHFRPGVLLHKNSCYLKQDLVRMFTAYIPITNFHFIPVPCFIFKMHSILKAFLNRKETGEEAKRVQEKETRAQLLRRFVKKTPPKADSLLALRHFECSR